MSAVVLPEVASARLPASYDAAKRALAECSRLDECQQWADKAEALASYAKQAKDDEMRKMADRIQARAIRRCGELLKQIPSGQGAVNQHKELPVGTVTRHQAATEAGLSERQKVTALRVASVEESVFNEQVESDTPPTVTALAEQGKKTLVDLGHRTPEGFKAATNVVGSLRSYVDVIQRFDAELVAGNVSKSEAAAIRRLVAIADGYHDRLITRLED